MIYKLKNFSIFLFVILLVVKLNGCFYSFTGASVPSHLKTIAIPVFEDKSGSGEPGLRENFTNELIQKFTDDNTLQVAPRTNADAVLDCSITSLSETFNSITTETNNQEAGSSKRLTITVRVIYKDLVQKKTISDKKYSEYGDYDLTGNIVSNRQAAITTAMDRITDDILLGTVSNW